MNETESPTNPLPPAEVDQAQPQVVYMSRPMEPQQVQVSPDAMRRHEESRRKYPNLNLSEGEYIISAVARHPIGLLQIWLGAGLLIGLILVVTAFLNGSLSDLGVSTEFGEMSPTTIAVPAMLLSLLVLVFAAIAAGIYSANRFYLTNESVIQHIQIGLFNKREQTVSLSNIEDASYTQKGIIPHLLDYGMIRLSTQGDETTYRFSYASRPRSQVATLNNAVEAFKNGRPVGPAGHH